MKAYRWILFLSLLVAAVLPASAQQQLIVRDKLGLNGLKLTCRILNCNVGINLGDPDGQVFLI
ncbi:MAG: hypothetical protein WA510_27000, partial [Acidobacteriaceae bacterium]